MSDKRDLIFISYAHQDRSMAAMLHEECVKQGWSVFWDDKLRNGDDWPEELENKLLEVKCVIVLWSKKAAKSPWVKAEADHARSRQVLVSARLDDTKLPVDYQNFQTDDLTNWQLGVPPPGVVRIFEKVRGLVDDTFIATDRTVKDNDIRRAGHHARTEHISISSHDSDRDTILNQLIDEPEEVRTYIVDGYRELEAAQTAAREDLNDGAPAVHYASAAAHFRNALDAIGAKRSRIARDGRSIEYFLIMEQANSLAFSETKRGQKHEEAIQLFRRLADDKRYRQDPPVHFRLGCALARSDRDRAKIQEAIRCFSKARTLAEASRERDGLVSEGQWLHFEIAKQMGLCNFILSQDPKITPTRRKSYLNDAIEHTRHAVLRNRPEKDPSDLVAFTVIKATGNLIYLLAQRLREGFGQQGDADDIASLIATLTDKDFWPVVGNQVRIIDSIAFGAATIGDWATAAHHAEANVENFTSMSKSQELDGTEIEMQARAGEISFFARRSLAM
jgi:tetratricopeptide (TPR) repeat protein